jgi:hypothetical protein
MLLFFKKVFTDDNIYMGKEGANHLYNIWYMYNY